MNRICPSEELLLNGQDLEKRSSSYSRMISYCLGRLATVQRRHQNSTSSIFLMPLKPIWLRI